MISNAFEGHNFGESTDYLAIKIINFFVNDVTILFISVMIG